MNHKILVTGSAGFIGFHLVEYLAQRGDRVIGIDNLNHYYDVRLKQARLHTSGIDIDALETHKPLSSHKYPHYTFIKQDLVDKEQLFQLFEQQQFDTVVNLAAQPGVRYSLENPHAYIDSNIVGFVNLLEACRHYPVRHLVYASSSSVYGLNAKMPYSTQDNVDHPISLYAATKKSNELMAHAYAYLYHIPVTGLRFFTVYGPWGRPDMVPFVFVKPILAGEPIKVFNHGQMRRDFTYIDDIIEGVGRVIDKVAQPNGHWDAQKPDPNSSKVAYKLYNIGHHQPVQLLDFIEAIERQLGKKAVKTLLPLQPGDVLSTYADIDDLYQDFGYKPKVAFQEGIARFISWYQDFYG